MTDNNNNVHNDESPAFAYDPMEDAFTEFAGALLVAVRAFQVWRALDQAQAQAWTDYLNGDAE